MPPPGWTEEKDMQRLILILLLGALGWYGYTKYQAKLASVEAGSGSARA